MDFYLDLDCSDLDVKVYSDADWGSDVNDRKSINGSVVMFGGATITWNSKKQKTVHCLQQNRNFMLQQWELRICCGLWG